MKYCGKCNRTYGGVQTLCPVDGERLNLKDLYGFVGQLIAGKYMVHELTNIGGMSAVYLAQQIGVDRRVAFKILLPNVAASNANLARLFEREAKTAGKLSHENIATIYDAGHTNEGVPYIVMEWLDGYTLERDIANGQPMSLERITHLLRQIAAALDTAHAKRIIHRDLKPGNIMLVKRADGQDQVKIVDFGLAKVGNQIGELQVSEAVGTPNYASPEQFQTGADIDPRTDIYSLGIMLYQLLTGHLPFQANTIAEAVRAHLLETPKPVTHYRPELPNEIEMILNRMLAKTPHYRPTSASEVAHVFEGVLAELRGETSLVSLNHPLSHQRAFAAHPQQAQNHAAPDDAPAYSLEDLFRPLYNDQPIAPDAFSGRLPGSGEIGLFASGAGESRPYSSGAVERNLSVQQPLSHSEQPLNFNTSQARAANTSNTRSAALGKKANEPVVNPAIGEGLSLPLIGNFPLPGSRRTQILAIIAILLSIGLCLAFFWMRKQEAALSVSMDKNTVLLAEFVNHLGAARVDSALLQTLTASLDQMPYQSFSAQEKLTMTSSY